MKYHPIPFSAPMVRPVLAGTKTQTRRVVKGLALEWLSAETGFTPEFVADKGNHMSPYGQPGDRLWVREAWRACAEADKTPPRDMTAAHRIWYEADQERQPGAGKYRPPMFMPRWASRILLEITAVRVERLQEISEADALAEGCERIDEDEPGHVWRYEPDWKVCPQCGGTRLYTAFSASGGALPDTDCQKCDTYVKRYRHLWESINGAGSWDANPWLWCVEFKRVPPC